MVVRTPRLRIRPLNDEDRAEFVRLHSASEEAFRPFKPGRGDGETWDDVFDFQLSGAVLGAFDGRRHVWIAELPDAEHQPMVGVFSLFDIFRGAVHGGIASWYVDAARQGRGYGAEAVQAMLDLAFAPRPDGLALHRVQANIRPVNRASLALALRLGFRVEGVARGYLYIDGDWRDHLFCAKLAEEHKPRWFVPESA
jgi:ribosomal-protein-alanine N-acetyltransferase